MMKKFFSLLIIGFILIGIGCGMLVYQISRDGLDLTPISNFIREVTDFSLTLEKNRLEFRRNSDN